MFLGVGNLGFLELKGLLRTFMARSLRREPNPGSPKPCCNATPTPFLYCKSDGVLHSNNAGNIRNLSQNNSLRGNLCGLAVLRRAVLGGSWYLVTNYNCTYNPNYNSIRALKGLISTVISTVIIG